MLLKKFTVSIGILFTLIFISCSHSSYASQIAVIKNTLSKEIPLIKQIDLGLPINLKIPKIKVDAYIESIGVASDGSVGVPKGPSSAAWFNLGPRPGEIGNSIIDGHSGWKNGIPAAFDNLIKLRKGDEILVKSDTGINTTFIVREIKTYGSNDNAPDVFISSDGKAHLNLITCTGLWNTKIKSHSSRLVVFADKK